MGLNQGSREVRKRRGTGLTIFIYIYYLYSHNLYTPSRHSFSSSYSFELYISHGVFNLRNEFSHASFGLTSGGTLSWIGSCAHNNIRGGLGGVQGGREWKGGSCYGTNHLVVSLYQPLRGGAVDVVFKNQRTGIECKNCFAQLFTQTMFGPCLDSFIGAVERACDAVECTIFIARGGGT